MSVKKVNKTTGATTKVAGLVNSEKVNTMYGAFPSDASASNKLVSDSTANEKISDAIADKADKVSSATNGNFAGLNASGNLTDSGKKASDFATAQALTDEAATRSALGAKNILPFDLADIKALNINGTWAGNVYTYRGVDFIVNSDGTISATGTATGGNASIKIFAASSNYEMLGKEVILTGCPDGGSATTYRIQAYRMASADGSTGTYFDDGAGTDAFTALNNASGTVGSFAVAVYENATVTNLLFKPMVRLASDSDDTYQPYAKTNKELTDDNVDWYSNGIIGAKNLIPFPYPKESDTVLGIDFTTNSNGEIIASGTSTGIAVYDVVNTELYGWNVPKEGTYILSDGLSDADYVYAYTAVTFMYNDGTIEYNVGDTSIGRTVITIPNNLKNFYVGCCIRTDKTVSNIKFKPMLRMIEDSDETFRLYAKTNRELTVDKAELTQISNPNLLDNPWFTVNQRGQSSYTGGAAYSLDRWRRTSARTELTVNSDYITFASSSSATNNSYVEQYIEDDIAKRFINKIVTVSILYADGHIEKASVLVPNYFGTSDSQTIIDTDSYSDSWLRFFYYGASQHYAVSVCTGYPSKSTNIKAVKLELGSVSTLAMDTAPNYQQELAKCQRYYQRIWQKVTTDTLCIAVQRSNTLLRTVLPLAVPMRANPTVTVSGTVSDYTNSGLTMSKISGVVENGGIIGLNFNITKSGVTWSDGEARLITPDANDFYIDFSADL